MSTGQPLIEKIEGVDKRESERGDIQVVLYICIHIYMLIIFHPSIYPFKFLSLITRSVYMFY
jgi:hypothetical protein